MYKAYLLITDLDGKTGIVMLYDDGGLQLASFEELTSTRKETIPECCIAEACNWLAKNEQCQIVCVSARPTPIEYKWKNMIDWDWAFSILTRRVGGSREA
ncbi:hypothetical protein KKD19_01460 [Patescibacteria group bacterium]|nr:hypothetical protein [Patescibacteria group bacterium]MBU4511900.1 hypothetical protein [Patescibacteria group bacterium]MCG2692868.1 hypothetical protein [Candidatus Parcubacteria bacterium]